MCFGGTPKTPDVPAPPPPSPVPVPSDVSPIQTAEQRANQVAQLKYGALSTIKTSAAGITGAGPDLITAAAGAGQKKTLGGA